MSKLKRFRELIVAWITFREKLPSNIVTNSQLDTLKSVLNSFDELFEKECALKTEVENHEIKS